MKGFHKNLVGIGPICNAKYSVLFNDELVTIISPTGIPVLKGWREATGNWLIDPFLPISLPVYLIARVSWQYHQNSLQTFQSKDMS